GLCALAHAMRKMPRACGICVGQNRRQSFLTIMPYLIGGPGMMQKDSSRPQQRGGAMRIFLDMKNDKRKHLHVAVSASSFAPENELHLMMRIEMMQAALLRRVSHHHRCEPKRHISFPHFLRRVASDNHPHSAVVNCG